MSRARVALILALLLPVTGCGLIAYAISLPIRVLVGLLAFTVAVIGSDGMSPQDELWAGGIEVDRHVVELEIASDLTYVATAEVVRTVTSTAGFSTAQQTSATFDPRSQSLEVSWAEVVNPDGTRHTVSAEQIFTRPSAAAQNTPGFVSSQTTTVVFPQLRVGSQTAVKWRYEERGASSLGFNYLWRAPFAYPVKEATIRISYPGELPLRHATRGSFDISEHLSGGRRVVQASLASYPGQTPERAMVDPLDVCPLFVATTVGSWEEIGAQFHAAVSDRIELTPEIREQAARITDGRTGLDAARAIHRWVATNVQYVAVYMAQMDGWIPHPASEVLADGYGDCKDQFVLLASLLRASGIECQPALANLGRSFEPLPLPTPLQFDHCFAYLPEFDLYSDPTDPFRDLGELDVPLSGKLVVLGTPEGRVARTPAGDANRNSYAVHHDVRLDSTGRLSGSSAFEATGRPAGFVRRTLALAGSPDQAADSLLQAAAEGGSGELRTTDPADLHVPLRAEGEWEADFPVEMGENIHVPVPAGIDLVNPAVLRRFITGGDRRYPAVIAAIGIRWTFEVELPDGYRFTRTPSGRSVVNDGASYESRYRVAADGKMHIERVLRIEQDRFSPEEYGLVRDALTAAGADAIDILIAERVP